MSTNLPTRTASGGDEDAVPDEDAAETTKLFQERLQAWKHACGYLEDYLKATEKMQDQSVKEYEKVLKTVSNPLKESNHFDQQQGGIAGLFDNIRANTQGLANSHIETAKVLKGTVQPILERLHAEIKSKSKEISKGAGKGAKQVDKARDATQKQIEALGKHTASFSSAGGSLSASDDPYVIHRGVYHRLNKQIMEENNNRQDMLAVQNNFAQFEAHVVQVFQQALTQFNNAMSNQADQTRNMYADINTNAAAVAPDFEWNGFVHRNDAILIDPNAPARKVENVSFPNQNHKSTQPLIAGSLERKGKVMKSYSAAYYAITPAKFLHEYKTDDDFAKEPIPENSLYLPDCVVGAVDGTKFQIKGKDSSKGSFGNKFSVSREYAFKAHTPADAQKWHSVIASCAGQSSNEMPVSPSESPAGQDEGTGELGGNNISTGPVTHTQAAPANTANTQSVPATAAASAATTGVPK